MKTILRAATLAAILLAGIPVAQAATQEYSFSGTMDSGVHSGSSFAGSFRFDNASGAADWLDVVWYQVGKLNFSFLGQSFSEANADAAPEVAFFNGKLLGLSASFSTGTPQLSFVAAYPGDAGPAYLAYDTALGLSGSGTVVYAPVPEPASSSMLLAGLGLLGVLASRRMKVS